MLMCRRTMTWFAVNEQNLGITLRSEKQRTANQEEREDDEEESPNGKKNEWLNKQAESFHSNAKQQMCREHAPAVKPSVPSPHSIGMPSLTRDLKQNQTAANPRKDNTPAPSPRKDNTPVA